MRDILRYMSWFSTRLVAVFVIAVVATTCHRAESPKPAPVRSRGGGEGVAAIPRIGAPPAVRAPEPISAPSLGEAFAGVRRPDYRALERALARYDTLAADSTIPEFPTPERLPVSPGDSLATANALRTRLAALGDLDRAAAADPDPWYSGDVVDAVRRFQARHGLDADGVIGRATLAQLQTPLRDRVTQIEAALVRIRREPVVDSGRFIVVNVPAFTLFAYDDGFRDTTPALVMKVIVGRAGRLDTPSLEEELQYLDFWPDWNVPRSILTREIIPLLRADTTYLHRQNMELMQGRDLALGDTVTPAVIEQLESGRLWVRQRRGPTNPLGRVKFAMPNDSNVYLHDTPDKSLFARARRDLSHGCIRLERARDLAIWAMRERPDWNTDSVDVALAGPAFRRVTLAQPIPVLVVYVTVVAMPDGTVRFVPDIYGRNGDPTNGW